MQLDCPVRHDGGVATVTPGGDVDLATTALLREALDGAINHPGTTRVEVDLANVTFLDSVGIGVLIAGYRAAGRRGVGFVVRNPGPMVRMVLGLAGVLDMLSNPEPQGAGA